MTTQTRTGAYLKKMANRGHFKQKLGETALALTECFCKADGSNQRLMGTHLLDEMHFVLVDIYGWNKESANAARNTLFKAMQDSRGEPKEVG